EGRTTYTRRLAQLGDSGIRTVAHVVRVPAFARALAEETPAAAVVEQRRMWSEAMLVEATAKVVERDASVRRERPGNWVFGVVASEVDDFKAVERPARRAPPHVKDLVLERADVRGHSGAFDT